MYEVQYPQSVTQLRPHRSLRQEIRGTCAKHRGGGAKHGLGDGSALEHTHCSGRSFRFGSQYPHQVAHNHLDASPRRSKAPF